MSHDHAGAGSSKRLCWAIAVVVVGYGLALVVGLPQRATEQIAHASHADHHGSAEEANTSAVPRAEGEGPAEATHSPAEQPKPADQAATAGQPKRAPAHPPYWMVVPFALMLLSIAILPLLPWTAHWWDSNLHKFYVAAALAALTLYYYLLWHHYPIEGHFPVHHVVYPSMWGIHVAGVRTVLENAILNEYVPFIVLLFSLYTIAGGIRVEGDLRAHPSTNCLFLAIGAALASFIGTTGAAMLLIRPLLETNQERKHVSHTVIFFTFIVCNCGGCLLPLGDPPLFLGYLRGVPFLWTFSLWREWLFVNGCLIAVYYVWDRFWCYPHEKPLDLLRDETRVRGLKISGLWPNAFLLGGVVLSVALLDPSQRFPGTEWHPWLYLREVVQLGLVGLSLALGSEAVRQANRFNYHAILEVAALFFGIFICMQPALQILHVEGPRLASIGFKEPYHFFWITGMLSSVLDNAPTYVVFFETARTLGGSPLVPPGRGVAEPLLVAISLGAVFMGANTYIGNGPNFMVKAIAEKSGVKMPSFFGYMLYSGLILIPLFVAVTLLFLR